MFFITLINTNSMYNRFIFICNILTKQLKSSILFSFIFTEGVKIKGNEIEKKNLSNNKKVLGE